MTAIVKEIERKTIQREVVERKCDICGKLIDPSNWFRIITSHHDWGNDSIESVESRDSCSAACTNEFSNEYINDSYNSSLNTKEINITHMRSIGKYDYEY